MEEKIRQLEAKGPLTSAQKAQQSAEGVVSTLSPYAKYYTSADNLGTYQKQRIMTSYETNPLNKFTDFVGTFSGQIGELTAKAGGWLWDETVKAVVAPINWATSIPEEININNRISANMRQLDSNNAKMGALLKAFQEGKITKDEYSKQLTELSKETDELRKDAEKNSKDAETNLADTKEEIIDTALDVVTVICAVGSGGLSTMVPTLAKSTSKEAVIPVVNFFGKKEVSATLIEHATKIDDIVNSVAKSVNKLSTFNGRMPSGQLIRIADATFKEGATNLTSKQIAKNLAVGVLLKRPLIYQTNVGLATDIYKDLLKGDLGGATLSTLATGAMALSGGPIGWALESMGKGMKWLKTAAYYSKSNVSRDSFFDALSSKIGGGDKGQFARAFAKRVADGKVDDVKLGNVMADINMEMAHGDSNVAADLIINWYKESSHGRKLLDEADVDKILDDMINYATTREELVQTAIKSGLSEGMAKRLVLGRATTEDKAMINKVLEKADELFAKKGGIQDFEELKKVRLEQLNKLIDRQGRTSAWTASDSFVSQVEDAINFSKTTKQMTKRINKIETGKLFKGKLPKGFREEMSKKGYIALLPEDTYTPYKGLDEVSGKIKTEFANTEIPTPKSGPFNMETNEKQINRILKNEDIVGDGEKIGDYYRKNKGKDWHVEYMSPEDYLKRDFQMTQKHYGGAESYEVWKKAVLSDEKVTKYAADMKKGDKFGMPLIDEVGIEQDGRHRVAAALLNGEKEIPVAVATKPGSSTQTVKTVAQESHIIEGPDIFEQAVKPLPVLTFITGALTKVGLSPQASQDAVQRVFQENFDNLLKGTSLIGHKIGGRTMRDGKDVMTKLYAYARKYNAKTTHFIRPITDIRQFTKNEIREALNCTEDQAKEVMRSLNTAMLQVPRDLRGLGDKVQDFNLKYNPMAAQYARTQGTFRYTVNPFFKVQQTTQTEFLSQVESGGKVFQIPGWNTLNRHLFDKEGMKMNDHVITLLQEKKVFAQGFTGEGFTGDVFSELGNRVIKGEKISLAGLVQKQARLAGYDDVGRYIDEHYSTVVDTLRAITISGRQKDFFDSPLARTINAAFFPFRFNMKVANLIANQLGKLNAPTQVALISNLMDAGEWLNSDEGIAWQSQYSEAIALFNWVTPTYPLSYVAKLAKDAVDPDDFAVGDLGMLGSLPFGMISQILEANGIISASAPYMDMKTGEVYPRYAPTSAAGEVNLAMQSFVGSLFSYPGSLFGLPSKSSIVRSVTNATVGGQYDFEAVSREEDLTPEKKREQQIIKEYRGTAPSIKATKNEISEVPVAKPKPDEAAIAKKMSTYKTKTKVRPRPIHR